MAHGALSVEQRWALVAAFFLLGLGVLAHAFLPRYEYQTTPDGMSLIIHDRWAGRFQKAVYDKDGQLSLQRVITPF